MSVFAALLRRDFALARREGGATLLVLGFFLIVVALFPFGVGPELEVLSRIAPGTLWVAALLAALLPLDRLFQADREDGSLDQLALLPLPLEFVVLAKVLAQWLTVGLPLVLLSPLLALLLNMPSEAMPTLVLSLALGTPALALIGAIGAALTVGVRRGGALLSILVLPLDVPILIFGAAAVDAAAQGFDPSANLMLLAAAGLAALALAPFAAAAALRLSLD